MLFSPALVFILYIGRLIIRFGYFCYYCVFECFCADSLIGPFVVKHALK